MLETIRVPLGLRVAGAVGRALTEMGLPVFPLDPDRIRAQAPSFRVRRLARDAGGARGPRAFVSLGIEDASLTNIGRFGVNDMLCNALSNRALWVAHKADDPARFETPLRTAHGGGLSAVGHDLAASPAGAGG